MSGKVKTAEMSWKEVEEKIASGAAAAVRGIGLVILCVAAIFLGRYLKTLLR